MSVQLITVIMSSTVISVFISSILNFLQNRKNSSLQYITQERKEWRNQIRNIAEEISDSNSDNIFGILDKLKVRINAYGNSKQANMLQDSHIWILINITKRSAYSSPIDFEKCKDLLIDVLSLLLKYDWDRSKWEVKGDANLLLEKVSLLTFWCVFVYSIFYFLGFHNITGLLIIFLLIFLFFNMYNKLSVDSSEIFKDDKPLKIDIHKKYSFVMTMYVLCVSIYLYLVSGSPVESIGNSFLDLLVGVLNYFVMIMLPYTFWYLIWIDKFIHELKSKENYIKITGNYLNQMSEIMASVQKEEEITNSKIAD